MKVLITYYTKTRHTEKVAELLLKDLEGNEMDVTLKNIDEVTEDQISNSELVIIGTPVHGLFIIAQKTSKPVSEFINSLPNDLNNKKFILFATYLVRPGKALRKAENSIKQKNGRVLGSIALRRNKKDE
ncbi:MAG: flavodoxin family protein [Candidatus Kariarchaeaceae archaeon]|jgi:menaquinone-dependent protoporphyrinogen IX oxidase